MFMNRLLNNRYAIGRKDNFQPTSKRQPSNERATVELSIRRDDSLLGDKVSAVIRIYKKELVCFTLKAEPACGLKNTGVQWDKAVDPDVVSVLNIMKSIVENIYCAASELNGSYIQSLHQDVTELGKIDDETWQKIRGIKFHLRQLKVDVSTANFLMHKPLLRMFAALRELVDVDLSYGHWQERHGISLLEALLKEGKAKRIKTLNITEFFKPGIHMTHNLKLIQLISSNKHLKTLSTSYSYFSSALLNALAKHQQNATLRFIGLTVCQGHYDDHVIPQEAWNNLLDSCPELKVAVAFDGITDAHVIKGVLVPCMPLMYTEITGVLRIIWQTEHAVAVLNHLREEFKHVLEEAVIQIRAQPEDMLDDLFLVWIKTAKKLNRLCLAAHVKPATVRNIVNMGLKRKTVLKTLKLKMLSATKQEREAVRKIINKHKHDLLLHDLSYKFTQEGGEGDCPGLPFAEE